MLPCAPLPQLGLPRINAHIQQGQWLVDCQLLYPNWGFSRWGRWDRLEWYNQKKHAMSCSLILKSNKMKCVTFQKQRDLSQNNANCAADLESNDLGKCLFLYIYVFACICLGNSHRSGEGLWAQVMFDFARIKKLWNVDIYIYSNFKIMLDWFPWS